MHQTLSQEMCSLVGLVQGQREATGLVAGLRGIPESKLQPCSSRFYILGFWRNWWAQLDDTAGTVASGLMMNLQQHDI